MCVICVYVSGMCLFHVCKSLLWLCCECVMSLYIYCVCCISVVNLCIAVVLMLESVYISGMCVFILCISVLWLWYILVKLWYECNVVYDDTSQADEQHKIPELYEVMRLDAIISKLHVFIDTFTESKKKVRLYSKSCVLPGVVLC